MNLSYCVYCLERSDLCECEVCDGDCTDVVFGQYRRNLVGKNKEDKE